jgi:hypothetical protein
MVRGMVNTALLIAIAVAIATGSTAAAVAVEVGRLSRLGGRRHRLGYDDG